MKAKKLKEREHVVNHAKYDIFMSMAYVRDFMHVFAIQYNI